MRYSLVNPPWHFEGSIYFGCREPHLPLEFGYAKALLEQAGHEVDLVDAQLDGLSNDDILARIRHFQPDITVLTTAPSYLFWRCAPPELRIPIETAAAIRHHAGTLVVVGPHASTTPRTAIAKIVADAAICGECEDILPTLQGPSVLWRDSNESNHPVPHATNMQSLPALQWPRESLSRHQHHHHRFDAPPDGPGAEMETSRGCPYHCTFCAKEQFRNNFRRRPLPVIEEELHNLKAAGAAYVYFIDEIFLAYPDVLECIQRANIRFGIQTRIDLWSEPMLDLLGDAGCVSIEAGVESITPQGREALDKKCRLSTDEITARLIHARRRVPFVQANLIDCSEDNPGDVAAWRAQLAQHGIWANQPVPMFPYPGSPDYRNRWGAEDDHAWERAHDFYLSRFHQFSDIQDQAPATLIQLETSR